MLVYKAKSMTILALTRLLYIVLLQLRYYRFSRRPSLTRKQIITYVQHRNSDCSTATRTEQGTAATWANTGSGRLIDGRLVHWQILFLGRENEESK